jgi:hypothetical protein
LRPHPAPTHPSCPAQMSRQSDSVLATVSYMSTVKLSWEL